MIETERIRELKGGEPRAGSYVLYWMQAAQREHYNHALEYAVERANELKKPVVVFFGLTDKYPDANARHYYFMLEGLHETKEALGERGIQMVVRRVSPEQGVVEMAREASMVVVDAAQLRPLRRWRKEAVKRVECPIYEVETNLIVPVTEASHKEEFSAGTFRPRIHRVLEEFMIGVRRKNVRADSLGLRFDGIDIDDVAKVVSGLNVDHSPARAEDFVGGTKEARKHLNRFLGNKLKHYEEQRNDPCADVLSNMSPYLHFGQISPLYVALKVARKGGSSAKAYLEELIVRRELSHNFVFYNGGYDRYDCLPDWALKTLAEHAADSRDFEYSKQQFEKAETHDPYWNAAQKEMMLTGKMHGYMRMYWGKKVLEWSPDPATAFDIALYLNNKYEIDGRDANGFTGVAWCFGKHDRAWGERPVFGKVRYMSAGGLKRKFDADAYVQKIESIEPTKGDKQ